MNTDTINMNKQVNNQRWKYYNKNSKEQYLMNNKPNK